MLEAAVKTFWLPKRGNTKEEYEDAFAFSPSRFAVADGATESSFSDIWSQLLTRQFTDAPPDHIRASSVPLEEWLRPLQRDWHKQIPWDRLPWYAEEKARTGAFSAFIGVEITPAPSRFRFVDFFRRRKGVTWHAIAVGDCCLFQVRNDALIRSFPFEKSEAFNSRPLLICSNPNRNQPVWKNLLQAEGECRDSDYFFLASDAIACWFLKEHEAGNKPWQKLLSLNDEAAFATLTDQLRSATAMRNDDTTLLICDWRER